MTIKGFWSELPRPIFGLSPMDGVTDAAFRHVSAKYGKPALIMTEFTSVEGIQAGALRLLDDFLYSDIERPIVAQLFGSDPEAFYKAAIVAATLGFDGVDINMGCPAKNITERGAGAALIRVPDHAVEIITRTKQALHDWSEGTSIRDLDLPEQLVQAVLARSAEGSRDRKSLPVSVKTRLGFDRPVTEEWISRILETEPAAITLHGRTLKQLYTGCADWEEIAKAARIVRPTETVFLGNGDVADLQDAKEKIARADTDGVLIGRAAQGNPWIFQGIEATPKQRLSLALEHSRYFDSLYPEKAFVRMRKHLLDYLKGFDGAKELRIELMRAKNLADVETVLLPVL